MEKETKQAGRRDPLHRQKAAIVWMLLAVVLLTAGFFVARAIVSVYHYEDVDGTVYRIQKKDGEYALYGKDGTLCDRNTEGYYLTERGTLVSIDKTSGSYKVYAHVDTEGSEQLGSGQNVLMFRQLTYDMKSTTDYARVIKSIQVKNEYGGYMFYRRMKNENLDDPTQKILTSDDPTDYTNEFGIEGHRETEFDQIMFASLASGCGYTYTRERLESPVSLQDGGVDWSEYGLAAETRTKTDEDGNTVEYAYEPVKYTITTMTGESHTVYLGDMTVAEDAYYARYEGRDRVYVLSAANLDDTVMMPLENMITSRIVYPMNLNSYFDVEDFTLRRGDELICHVTYIPDKDREGTLYFRAPYRVATEYMEGYLPDADNITAMLQSMYAMVFKETVKLGPSKADLAEYGLDTPAHRIAFTYHIPKSEGGGDSHNEVLISKKTAEGLYYAYAPEYDMIVSFDESQAPYLEWTEDKWYQREYFGFDRAHAVQIKVESPDYAVVFDLDNSRSNQSEGPSSEKMEVYANGKLLNYTVLSEKWNGTKIPLSARDNFARFYEVLAYCSVEGMADLSEEEMADFRSMPDSDCQLKLTVTLQAEKGDPVCMVIRFYRYSERRSYMTVEMLDSPDAPSDGTAAQGRFCVLRSSCDKLIADARRVVEGVEVIVESKN